MIVLLGIKDYNKSTPIVELDKTLRKQFKWPTTTMDLLLTPTSEPIEVDTSPQSAVRVSRKIDLSESTRHLDQVVENC